MTAKLFLVLENPEKSLSTSFFAFSLISLPSFWKNPVWPAEHSKLDRHGRVDFGRLRKKAAP